MRYIALILSALIPIFAAGMATTPAMALKDVGGGAGKQGSICDVNAMTCQCKGVLEGAYCAAMRRNCADKQPGYPDPISCTASGCTCTMKVVTPPRQKVPTVTALKGGAGASGAGAAPQ